jgi:hypothetical protein
MNAYSPTTRKKAAASCTVDVAETVPSPSARILLSVLVHVPPINEVLYSTS